jgi:hypothetical protein
LNNWREIRVPYDVPTVAAAPVEVIPSAADLVRRAEAVRAENALLCRFPGTGFHELDRNPAQPSILMAPQHYGYPPISQNTVPFYGEDNIRFVGVDAEVAFDALNTWHKANCSRDVAELATNGTELKMVRYIPHLSLQDDNGIPVLVLRRDRWNDYHYVLDNMKVGMSGQPLKG